MICEYCGGEVLPLKEFYKEWRRGECSVCHTGYAFRKTKEFHEKTLVKIYGDDYEAVIKAYQKRIQELIERAKV